MKANQKFHFLQGVRAVAACLVIIDHSLLELTHNDSGNKLTHIAWTLGSSGVYLFFVISGFIMTHICWDSFGQQGVSAKFLRRRLFRIVPLYWFATIVALAYHRVSATHGADAGWSELALSFAFIPYAGVDGGWNPILPQGWTLNYEMMFYGVFTLALTLPRRVALPAIGAALGGFVAIGPLLPNSALAYLASPIVLWFVLGIGLAALWRRCGFQEPAWLARPAKHLEPLGDASYSTYLAHGLVLTFMLRAWTMGVGAPSFWLVPVSLVGATVAGWATHVMIERPILRITTDLWGPYRKAAASPKVPEAT